MNSLSTNQKVLISALIGFVIGAGAVLVWNVSRSDTPVGDNSLTTQTQNAGNSNTDAGDVSAAVSDNTSTQPNPVRTAGGDHVNADDQSAGSLVQVSTIVFERAGWVAVQENANGELGNVLGAAWFPAGTSSGSVELLRDTVPGNVYHVVLYHDNGNKEFELGVDEKLVDASGLPVMDTFSTNPAR